MNSKGEPLDLSLFGNYIFIIATNKTFKSFREIEYITKTFSYKDNDKIDDSLKKCFEIDDGETRKQNITEKKPPKVTKIYREEEEEEKGYESEFKKVSKNKELVQAYKSLNYLMKNINKEKNCRANMIYFDTYLNCITPKCVLFKKYLK